VIYLIGGPARCGKSTLAERVRHQVNGDVISADAFKKTLLQNLRPSWTPDIFDHVIAPIGSMSSATRQIDRLRRRDERMWQFYSGYIDADLQASPHKDILIEGNIWPDFIADERYDHKAVFLIDLAPAEEQFERLRKIRDSEDDNNWMKARDFNDRALKKWAKFNRLRSQRYAQLCRENSYSYFDISQRGIGYAQDRAYAFLLQK
jgi:2-phosphoglycerate kinase